MESRYSCIIYSRVVYVANLTCPQLYVLSFHGNIVKKSSKPFSLVSVFYYYKKIEIVVYYIVVVVSAVCLLIPAIWI